MNYLFQRELYRVGNALLERGDLSENISCTGNLKLRNSVVVNFKISGTVAEVIADFNQKIRKGQPLASLDSFQHYSENSPFYGRK